MCPSRMTERSSDTTPVADGVLLGTRSKGYIDLTVSVCASLRLEQTSFVALGISHIESLSNGFLALRCRVMELCFWIRNSV